MIPSVAPRPRLGRRRTSRTRARASEVRASDCRGERGPVAPAPHGLGDNRMMGGIVGLLYAGDGTEMGERGSGPARWWPWTGLLPPGGPGIGPRSADLRGVTGGRRRQPTLETAAKRRRRTGGCSRPWRPGSRRCDCLGRLAVATGQFQGARGSAGTGARSVVIVASVKLVIS